MQTADLRSIKKLKSIRNRGEVKMYKPQKMTETFVEVDANDNFLREMKDAAGTDGVHVTTIGRALPLPSEEGQFNKSKFFMIFTGAAENPQGGKPNPAQREVMNTWGAKRFPDRESWDIGRKVATDIADGVKPKASTEPYEAFAQPAFD